MGPRHFILVVGLFTATAAVAADEGFYGGLTVRSSTPKTPLDIGSLPSAWAKLSSGAKDVNSGGTLLYGGYRFPQVPVVGVEAALSSTEEASGLGLRLDPTALGGRLGHMEPHNWNVDLFTNVAVNPSVGVYGRMGYEYSDVVRSMSNGSALTIADASAHHYRDGFNYGVGMRYDLNRSLGLRLEVSRFAHFGNDPTPPSQQQDSDQVSIGVQYRF